MGIAKKAMREAFEEVGRLRDDMKRILEEMAERGDEGGMWGRYEEMRFKEKFNLDVLHTIVGMYLEQLDGE
jgi:hypothetical protein